MSTPTRLTYNLFTYCTIFTKLTHLSTNSHHISTSLLCFLTHTSKLGTPLIYLHLYTSLLHTFSPYTFILLSLPALRKTLLFIHLIYTFTRYFSLSFLYFTLFLPRLYATNNNTFSHYQRLNALFLLLVNPPTALPYSPQSISPAAPSMLVDNLY